MSNNTKKNDHFYLLHRGKTWALKDATKEELDAIRDLFKNDTAKNLNKLYLLTDKVWNTVIKHYANAKSDPSANVSPAVILKHYFKSFDLSQGVQWLDWTVKNPTYTEWNGANAVFALEESAKTEAGDDTEPESDGDDTNDNVDDSRCPIFNKSIESYLSQSQSGEDSTHAQGIPTTFLSTAKQRNVTFDDETIIITKETTEQGAQNTQHDDNHNINNGNSGSDGTNLQSGMVQKDTEDDDLKKIIAAENWLHLANVHVTKLQELVARNGPENCSTYKLTFGAELIKLLIYEKLGVGEPYRTWLRKIWPGSTDEIFGNLMNKLIPANRRWLIANGYLSENEIQLKTFVCRANELGGINLNMNLSNKRSKNIDEPRNSKRRRLNETVPLNNLSLTNTTINHSNQNPSNSNLNVSRPSPITPSNPLAITSMDDLKKALQTDEVKKLFLSLHNIPPTTTNNSSVSNSSTSNNANPPTDNSSGSTASKQIDSIQNQLNQLTAMIKNQMPQSNASNPNKNHVALTYSKPERGWNTITVDKNEMGSMLTRVQNITNGTAIDPQLQGVITSMNLETNKQLCKKLDASEKKDETSTKVKKKSVEDIIFCIFKWFLHLCGPSSLNVSDIIYQSLRNKPMVKNMNRIDTNAVMLKCFSIKQNVSTGLYAVINMIETYEQRSSETILRERAAGVYNKAKYDDWIRASIVIFKRDIRDAIATLNVMIRDKEVTSSALWFIVNQTAKKAMENGIKWVHYLTQNSLIKDLQYRGSIPIDQWLLNAGLGFDESAYKKELDRAKDSDSNKKANRSAVSTIANFVQGLKNGMNSEKSFTTKGNRRLRAKAKGSFSFKKAKGEVETLLQSILPNATWDNRYCVFYHHPTATCRHDNKCKRKHECPSCDLEHKLEDCPDKVKQQ